MTATRHRRTDPAKRTEAAVRMRQSGWTLRKIAGFTLLTGLVFHNHFADQIQEIMFLKNVAIAGGLLATVALSFSLSAQSAHTGLGAGSGVTSPAKTQATRYVSVQTPTVIRSCEGDQCSHNGAGLWVFNGSAGRAAWGSKSNARSIK